MGTMSHELAVHEAEKAGLPNVAISIKRLADSDTALADSLKSIQQNQKEIADMLKNAFPAGDTDGHRRYHEALLRRAEANEKLALAIREKTISALIWATLCFVAIAIWHELGTIIKSIVAPFTTPRP